MPPARPRPAAHRRGAGSAGRARPCGNVQTAWSASWARFWIRVRIWRRRPADASLFGLVAALFFAAVAVLVVSGRLDVAATGSHRSEEHTSELQSLMRHSYAVFCLQNKK